MYEGLIRERSADLLIRRLEALGPLDGAARSFISGITPRRYDHVAGEELCEEGALIRTPRLVISGWGCRLRYLPDGRRQIFTFLLPGDTLGISERLEPLALTSAVTLTAMETVDMSAMATALRSGAPEHAGLASAVALIARSEEAALLDPMVRLGRQTAYERTAHLLVELCHRLAVVGLGDRRFRLPLTQEILADALGLSLVHVNRTLMQLRRDRLVILKGSAAELPDLERLALIANYAPQPLQRPDGSPDAKVGPAFG
jgi:CRP-like cAMP-binding protein